MGVVSKANVKAANAALKALNRKWEDTFVVPMGNFYVCDWQMNNEDWEKIQVATQNLVKWYDEGDLFERRKSKTVKGIGRIKKLKTHIIKKVG